MILKKTQFPIKKVKTASYDEINESVSVFLFYYKTPVWSMALFYTHMVFEAYIEAGHLGTSPWWHMTAEALTWAVARRDVATCVFVKKQGPVTPDNSPQCPLLWMTIHAH